MKEYEIWTIWVEIDERMRKDRDLNAICRSILKRTFSKFVFVILDLLVLKLDTKYKKKIR